MFLNKKQIGKPLFSKFRINDIPPQFWSFALTKIYCYLAIYYIFRRMGFLNCFAFCGKYNDSLSFLNIKHWYTLLIYSVLFVDYSSKFPSDSKFRNNSSSCYPLCFWIKNQLTSYWFLNLELMTLQHRFRSFALREID